MGGSCCRCWEVCSWKKSSESIGSVCPWRSSEESSESNWWVGPSRWRWRKCLETPTFIVQRDSISTVSRLAGSKQGIPGRTIEEVSRVEGWTRTRSKKEALIFCKLHIYACDQVTLRTCLPHILELYLRPTLQRMLRHWKKSVRHNKVDLPKSVAILFFNMTILGFSPWTRTTLRGATCLTRSRMPFASVWALNDRCWTCSLAQCDGSECFSSTELQLTAKLTRIRHVRPTL